MSIFCSSRRQRTLGERTLCSVVLTVPAGSPQQLRGRAPAYLQRACPNPEGMAMRKHLLVVASFVIGCLSTASAEVYPSRPVTIVVPFAAGGPTDSMARLIADRMRRALAQPVIVENVTGAGGSLGVARVVHALPDGYTVGIGNWSTHVVNGAIYPLRYDLINDLDPVAMLPSSPQLIVSNNDVPAKNLAELIAWLKTHSAATGTAGAGSASHVAGLYFQSLTGAHLSYVPYRGTAPAVQDLMGGQINLMFDQSSNSLPHVRAGNIRAYAVSSKVRLASAPDIPTVDEDGLPGFHISVWHGLWMPKGTPQDVIAKLRDAVVEVLADPAVRARFAALGQDLPTEEQLTPAGLARMQRAEIDKWWPIIKAASIKAD